MKKTAAMILAGAMLVSLTACASSGSGTGSTTAAAQASAGTQAAAASASGGDVFKIGVVAPLSGSSANSGAIMKNSVEMAVNEINEAGGVDGILFEMVAEDDEGVPATSVTVVQKLIESDGVNAVIGGQASSCTLANMEVTKAAKIPQITPASSNVTITQQGNDYIYRMTSTDNTNARTLLKYCSEALGAKKIAMLYESSDFGTGGYNIVNSLVGEYGIEIVDAEVYNAGDTDYSVALTKMLKAEPDVFFFWGYYTETAMICTQMLQQGIDMPKVGYGFNSPELVNLGGSAVDGIKFCTSFDAANPAEKVQNFDKKYTELYGAGYDQNAPQSYDAVYVLADAVSRAKADGADWSDGEVLNGYIRDTEYEGATGKTSFDETGEMVKDLMMITITDGVHEIVEW